MDAVFLLIGILSATIGALSFAATGDPWALLLTLTASTALARRFRV